MNKEFFQSEQIQKAVEGVINYFDEMVFFSDLQSEVLDASVKVLETYQDVDNCDGDTRPYALVCYMRDMLELMKPFAQAIGQADELYKPVARQHLAERCAEIDRKYKKTA